MASDGVNHIYSVYELNSTNYPGLTGTVLKFAAGSYGAYNMQFLALTTTGLFAWSLPGTVLSTTIKNTNAFGSVAIGTFGVSGE